MTISPSPLLRCYKTVSPLLTPRAWALLCALLAAGWFLIYYPYMVLNKPKRLPRTMLPMLRGQPVDFGQYYAGAVAAKYNLWEALYPIRKEEIFANPPRFVPKYRLLLPYVAAEDGTVVSEPRLVRAIASEFHPRLLEQEPNIALSRNRYIYPPPLALLLSPLASLEMRTASHIVFPILSMAAYFGMAIFSARILRHLAGRALYTEGFIYLAAIAFSYYGLNHLRQGNCSPFLSLFIALAVYSWIKGWQTAVGFAMIPMLLLKAVSLNWCPLLLLPRTRWKTLLTLFLLSLLLNGVTLALGGVEVYRQFFTLVIPSMGGPAGDGLAATLLFNFGFYPKLAYPLLGGLLSLLIYAAYYRHPAPPEEKGRSEPIVAALCALMCIFSLFNTTNYPPYFICYIAFPFLGWLLLEFHRSRGKWRAFMITGFLILAPHTLAGRETNIRIHHLLGITADDFLGAHTWGFITLTFGPLFCLTIALRRLLITPAPRPQPLPRAVPQAISV